MRAIPWWIPVIVTLLAFHPARADGVDLAVDQFVLPNGLRVVVHTDRKAPVVAVDVWYHVGGKNEAVGHRGLAHLFEHLMIQGSEHHRGGFLPAFDELGATVDDATTTDDRTNYFETVPTTALDAVLWIESDRMGHLLGAIDQGVLDQQRGVVQNEQRQREGQPYGRAFGTILQWAFPAGHPYHYAASAAMADVTAAKLDDARSWFRSWYGPNNAVLVLVGDIDLATARDKVTRYFGDLAPSASLAKLAPRIAARTRALRVTDTDRVPQTRIYREWNVPQAGSAELHRLELLVQVLAVSRSSRLQRRLQLDDALADRVTAFVVPQELASMVIVMVDVKPGVDPAKVEAALDDEVAALIAHGPTAAELAGARVALEARFVRGLEQLGGFGGTADVLAECAVLVGDPACQRARLANLAAATPVQVGASGRAWLGRGALTLRIDPGERKPSADEPVHAARTPSPVAPPDRRLKALPSTVDRTLGMPAVEHFPALRFPAIRRATLRNGLEVVVAERRGLPLIELSLQLAGAGFASDPPRAPGIAGLALAMLEEGAGDDDARAFAARKEALGAELGATGTLDAATVKLSALTPRLDDSLALLADVVLRPRLAAADLERVRGARRAAIQQAQAQPDALIKRLAGPLLFPAGHPYANPASGTGSEASLAAIGRDDLAAWLAAHVRPDRATLIVVGDTDLATIQPKLERAFAGWRAPAASPTPAIPAVAPTGGRVLLIDRPGTVQATIAALQVVPPSTDPGAIDLELVNGVLGGEFGARLNQVLREDKHWSYGAYSWITSALGPRVWTASAAVQIDKTADALVELRRAITELATGRAPVTPAELARLQAIRLRGLPGSFETHAAVLDALGAIVLFHRPDDYPQRRADQIAAATPARLAAAARTLQPAAITWIVAGDLKTIEAPIRALRLGTVQVIDPDGRVVR